MKEMIGLQTIHEVKKMTSNAPVKMPSIVTIHCSWCANCSGIVGD